MSPLSGYAIFILALLHICCFLIQFTKAFFFLIHFHAFNKLNSQIYIKYDHFIYRIDFITNLICFVFFFFSVDKKFNVDNIFVCCC